MLAYIGSGMLEIDFFPKRYLQKKTNAFLFSLLVFTAKISLKDLGFQLSIRPLGLEFH